MARSSVRYRRQRLDAAASPGRFSNATHYICQASSLVVQNVVTTSGRRHRPRNRARARSDTLHGRCRCQTQRLGMRVGTERGGFALGVGQGRVTLDSHIYVDLLLDVDLRLDVHKLLELYSKCFSHFVLLLLSRCSHARTQLALPPARKENLALHASKKATVHWKMHLAA